MRRARERNAKPKAVKGPEPLQRPVPAWTGRAPFGTVAYRRAQKPDWEEALMQRLGTPDLLVLFMFVALVLDSRRFHAFLRSADRGRRRSTTGGGIPAGADPTRVGLPLRQIQMRNHV